MQEADPRGRPAPRGPAYYGLVEMQDRHIGAVYDAFQAYLQRTGREGVFLYVSGPWRHERHPMGITASRSFTTLPCTSPLWCRATALAQGRTIESPVSPAGRGAHGLRTGGGRAAARRRQEPGAAAGGGDRGPRADGAQRTVHLPGGRRDFPWAAWSAGKDWKYFVYSGLEDDPHLYRCSLDPNEEHNVAAQYPDVAARLKAFAGPLQELPTRVMVHERWAMRQLKILRNCNFDDRRNAGSARNFPELEHPVLHEEEFRAYAMGDPV